MRGIVGHPADLDRHQGVMKALAEHPGITLLPSNEGVGTGWDPDKGTKLINELITSGGYDDIDGIWTSGIDQQVVDAIQAAGKPFVPIVGADLKGFVDQLLNTSGKYEGLKGIAVYNPAAVGGAGVKLAIEVLNGETTRPRDRQATIAGRRHDIRRSSCPHPRRTTTSPKRARPSSQEIDDRRLEPLWPVSWYIDGWTDYTFEQMLACKGPGE